MRVESGRVVGDEAGETGPRARAEEGQVRDEEVAGKVGRRPARVERRDVREIEVGSDGGVEAVVARVGRVVRTFRLRKHAKNLCVRCMHSCTRLCGTARLERCSEVRWRACGAVRSGVRHLAFGGQAADGVIGRTPPQLHVGVKIDEPVDAG